jgi:predicted dehydrogenase
MTRRILIVGHGSIGKRHLRIVRSSLPDADIRVLRHQPCAETPELANGCFGSLADALAFSPELAVLANPAPFHLAIARPLAERGCHLLIEKPLADKPDAVRALLDTTTAHGIILQVGYNLRFLPSLVRFRDLVREKRFGRTLSVRCEIGQYLPSWRPGTDYRLGVSARSELGGGVLLELSHELDYLRWIFGEIAWVNAWTGKLSGLEIDVEDTAHLTLGHVGRDPGNAPVTSLSMDFIRHDTTRTCLAIGEAGSLRWQAASGRIDYLPAGAVIWETIFEHMPERDESYLAQWRHFLDCVASGRRPLVPGEDGLATLAVIAAARQSAAREGMRITIPR